MGQIAFVLILVLVVIVGALILIPVCDWSGEAQENVSNFWERIEQAASDALDNLEATPAPVVSQ